MPADKYTVKLRFGAYQAIPGVSTRWSPFLMANGRQVIGPGSTSAESFATYEEAVAAAKRFAKGLYAEVAHD
jgi:hypothetical protein